MDKKVLMGIGVSLLVIFAVVMAGCVAEDDNTYIVGIDAAYDPFSVVDEKGDATGFDVECMQWIADEQGIEIKFQATAWDGIVPALQTGKIDIIYSGMSITPDRQEKVDFSNVYWTVSPAVAALAGSDITMEQFYNGDVIIGVQSGCSSDEWLTEHFGEEKYNQMIKDEKIKRFDTFPLSMIAVEQKLVDVAVFDDTGVDEYISEKDNLVKIGEADSEEPFGIAVRKGDTELLTIINEGLEKLMASDKWTELKEKYGLVEE